MNLGKLMDDLAQGRTPNGTRKKIRFLKPEKPFKGDLIGIRKNYIDPFIMNSYLNDTTHFLRTFRQANTKDEYSEKYLELLRSQ